MVQAEGQLTAEDAQVRGGVVQAEGQLSAEDAQVRGGVVQAEGQLTAEDAQVSHLPKSSLVSLSII